MNAYKDIGFPESGYYVYIIYNDTLDDVLYIGKGKDKRVLAHFKETSKNHVAVKISTLKKIGYDIKYKIISHHIDEKEAYKFEKQLIQSFVSKGIDLLNISMTDKDIYLQKELKEGILAIEKFIEFYYYPNIQGSKYQIKFKKKINSIIRALKRKYSPYKKLMAKYKVLNIGFDKIHRIYLCSNKINVMLE